MMLRRVSAFSIALISIVLAAQAAIAKCYPKPIDGRGNPPAGTVGGSGRR